MLVNSVFAFLVPYAAREGGWVGLCIVRFIQGLGEGPIVRDYIICVVIAKVYLIYLPALGAVHPCVVGEVDSAERAVANGRLCVCRRAIRNRHLDAAVGAFSRVRLRRRLAVK